MPKQPTRFWGFALVVCRNEEGKWLAVKETRGRGWWLPGGFVESGESFQQAAIRECREESHIDVRLEGILRVEFDHGTENTRMRVVFYAVPVRPGQAIKTTPDSESEEARWVTRPELEELGQGKGRLRGPELLEWSWYVENGGAIHPLSILSNEGAIIPAR